MVRRQLHIFCLAVLLVPVGLIASLVVFCVSLAIKERIFESTLARSKPEIAIFLHGSYYFARQTIIT